MTLHLLTPEYPPMPGGVSDYTQNIAHALAQAGEEVHVWCPAIAPRPARAGVVVHPDLGRFGPRDLERVGRLLDGFDQPRRLVVQWVPHGYGRRAMNVSFCLWLWRRSVAGDLVELVVHEPFVTFSGGIRQLAVAAVQRAMTMIIMAAARRVWVTTRAWTPLLEPYLAGRGIEIQWLPVPSNLPPADAATVNEVRKRYASGKGGLVGHFGTHGPLVTSLLDDAIVLAAEAHPSARFLLIGSGSEAFRSALVTSDRGLADRVDATGPLERR